MMTEVVAPKGKRPSSRERGYTWQWEKVRNAYLKKNPLCVMCYMKGSVRFADVVDHIIPHKGNENLMWDQRNLQSLCYHHHNSDKQMQESGKRPQIGLDGWPIN